MSYGEKYLNEMNKYPVIYLTLKDVKRDTCEEFTDSFKAIIFILYSNYDFLLKSGKIRDIDKEYMNRCINEQEIINYHWH